MLHVTFNGNVLDVTRIPTLTPTLALKHLSCMTLIANNGGMIKGQQPWGCIAHIPTYVFGTPKLRTRMRVCMEG